MHQGGECERREACGRRVGARTQDDGHHKTDDDASGHCTAEVCQVLRQDIAGGTFLT